MTGLMILPILLPLLAAAAAKWLLRGAAPRAMLAPCTAAGVLVVAVLLAVQVSSQGPQTVSGLLRVDALSSWLLIVIGAVALISGVATPAYLRADRELGHGDPATARRYDVLVQLFLAVMALAVLAAGIGVLWVAIEATTVVTAFLVGQHRGRAAVEAAWKYVVISSTGIALALLGIFLLNFAALRATGSDGLTWDSLVASASQLDPAVTRIAVLLLILGFGTKAGLAPLHAWLPDAHSQAPAPVSALMSGVLISVAFYAVLRVKVIADAALGVEFTRTLLLVMSLASLALAATLMIAQRDHKRMLAYSSIENMGLMALGAAIGSRLAIAAVLLHMLGHGLVKSGLFIGAGRILQVTGTTRIDGVRGLAGQAPVLAGAFGVGVLAVVGFPPFSLFASELGIATAGFAQGMGVVTGIALMLALVAAGALMVHTSRMLLGSGPSEPAEAVDAGEVVGIAAHRAAAGGPIAVATAASGPAAAAGTAMATRRAAVASPSGSRPGSDTWAMIGALVGCAVLGVWAGPLGGLLEQATTVVVGAP
jgi:hydrogenase-4 component F